VARKQPGAPDDLVGRLSAIEGVTVEGSYGGRAQIRATPAAVERVRAELSRDYYVEPLLSRYSVAGP
jgi:hypothetical protein